MCDDLVKVMLVANFTFIGLAFLNFTYQAFKRKDWTDALCRSIDQFFALAAFVLMYAMFAK